MISYVIHTNTFRSILAVFSHGLFAFFLFTSISISAAEKFETKVGQYVMVDTIDGSKVVGKIIQSEPDFIMLKSNLFPHGRKILRFSIRNVEEIEPIAMKSQFKNYRVKPTLGAGYYFGFTVGDIAEKLPTGMSGYVQYTQGLDDLLWSNLIDSYKPHFLFPGARYELNINSFSKDNNSILAFHNYFGPNWHYQITQLDWIEFSILTGFTFFNLEVGNNSYDQLSSNNLVVLGYKRLVEQFILDLQYRFAVLYDEKPTLMNMGLSLGFSFTL